MPDEQPATAAPFYYPFCRDVAHVEVKHVEWVGGRCDCPCHGSAAPWWADRRPERPRHAV